MLGAGIPLVRGLECLSRQEEAPNFGLVVQEVVKKVSAGSSLSESIRAFPRVFSPLYAAMLRVGEASGNLAEALDRLGGWLERDDATYRKVKQALTYPLLVLAAGIAMTMGLFTFVVPRFLEIIVQMGGPLPLPTQIVLGFSNLAGNPGFWVLLIMVIANLYHAFGRVWKTQDGRLRVYQVVLRVPVAGNILRCASLSRFSSAGEMALSNGVGILECCELAGQASSSPLIIADMSSLRESIRAGETLTEHMTSRPEIYGVMMVSMVAAGEETARVDKALRSCSRYYDEEVNHLIEAFGSIIEPVLIVGMGILVAFILMSVFLPMYSIISAL